MEEGELDGEKEIVWFVVLYLEPLSNSKPPQTYLHLVYTDDDHDRCLRPALLLHRHITIVERLLFLVCRPTCCLAGEWERTQDAVSESQEEELSQVI